MSSELDEYFIQWCGVFATNKTVIPYLHTINFICFRNKANNWFFTVADVLSISFALTSVVVFLVITTSPFRLVDFSHSFPNKLKRGLTLLFLFVFMMMIALGATILLMIHKGEEWTKTILYAVSFMPVGLFALSYFPLYLSLSKTFENFLEKAWRVILLSRPRETKFYTRTANPSNHQSTMSVWECYNDRLLESLVAYKNFLLDKIVRAWAASLFFFLFSFLNFLCIKYYLENCVIDFQKWKRIYIFIYM